MAQRQVIFLVLAAIVGIGMVLLARNLLSTPAPTAAKVAAVADTQVLVAVNNVPSGSFLQQKDFTWRTWPGDTPTDGLFVSGKGNDNSYVGGVLREGVKAGEPLLRGRVTMPNEGGFLSAVLKPGMRAMTIKVTPTSGVAGLIFPNDRVDVILAHRLERPGEPGDGQRRVSETVLLNVRVLALDQKTNDQDKKPKVAELATLEVSIKQAEKLALVAQMGTLSLVLRSVASDVAIDPDAMQTAIDTMPPVQLPVGNDAGALTQSAGTAPVTYDATWDSDVSTAVPPPNNRHGSDRRVQIMRGGESSDVVVPNTIHGIPAGER